MGLLDPWLGDPRISITLQVLVLLGTDIGAYVGSYSNPHDEHCVYSNQHNELCGYSNPCDECCSYSNPNDKHCSYSNPHDGQCSYCTREPTDGSISHPYTEEKI
ncbi:hypothetical protein llap_7194 [Limosa lapponica baueri]|uniref:Uncharacterized protein n=1 Tax=Limosa lapponica baueri TaxID=1758121 RepID=A0A2I0U8X3_LIMLA|nr:hypothetical protein llap_7194 [Limosa lapponica baueri]